MFTLDLDRQRGENSLALGPTAVWKPCYADLPPGDRKKSMNRCILLLFFLITSLYGCSTPDYRDLRIDPMEREMGYLSSENEHRFLPWILGGYTKGPKSLVYSVPLLSWYVNSKQHKGYAFISPIVAYNIDSIQYASDNRMAGYKSVNFWLLGLIGYIESLQGVHRGEEVRRSFYWLFPLFSGGEDEDGAYFNLLMFIPVF